MQRLAAVALDLDGTLLTSQKTISADNVAAVRAAAAQGVQIIIATGRMTPSVLPHARTLGVPDLAMVTYNGAAAVNGAGTVVFHRPLALDVCDKVLDYCARTLRAVNIYVGDTLYAGDHPAYQKYIEAYERLVKINAVRVSSYEQFRDRQSTKLIVFCDEDEHTVQRLFDEFKTLLAGEPVHLVRAEFFVEILRKDVNKGVGLASLAHHLNIPLSDIVAMGDGENDVEFLQVAGFSVAMGNGHQLAKQAARKVSPLTNDQNAVGAELLMLLDDPNIPKGRAA